MKQTLLTVLLVMALCLSSCGYQEKELILPAESAIRSVMVTEDKMITVHMKPQWIKQFISAVECAEPTAKESVRDVPDETYIKVDFIFDQGGESTIYLYQKGDTYYAEQPYQGIYKIEDQVMELVQA